MKTAIISDVHGNLTALEAVVADLDRVGPDLIVHGGDLAFAGPRPAEVIDRIRDLGWAGIVGNTDELLWNIDGLPDLPAPAKEAFKLQSEATRVWAGEERIQWLQALPSEWKGHGVGLVHAVPGNLWTVISPDADDAIISATFGPLGTPIAVYGHIHRPFVRRLPDLIVANTGSVGASFDGDIRASYLLIENGNPEVRRVEYDLEQELAVFANSGYPFAETQCESRRQASPPVWQ
jgi:putative phosphoesterase